MPGKDLQIFEQLPRSPLLSYLARAGEQQRRFHYTLSALEPQALWQWITQYLGHRIGFRHKFLTYDGTSGDRGVYQLGDDSVIGGRPDSRREIRVSLAGDWGTGTDEAAEVAAGIEKFAPHYTIHLGDVYYVGEKNEVEENCLGQPPPNCRFTPCRWPIGSVGSFALNGNHEMYALGKAYFDVFLPTLGMRTNVGGGPSGQKASFFCLENEFWKVIGLDTGYNSIGIPVIEYLFSPSCKLRKEEVQWLQDQLKLKTDSTHGLIVLTHHQYCSAFDSEYPSTAQQLSDLIGRPVLWLWGHEHRMAIYGKYSRGKGIQCYGRCIGHGGMPVDINPKVKRADRPLVAYDNRQYDSPENITVGYNGFANLTFQGDQVVIEYRDLYDTLLLSETWQVRNGNLSGTARLGPPAPGLTVHTDVKTATS
ncbi:MAG TPA: metallophosphoesterase [Acidobacteriota bacterium]|nr:metallophosphoesterase [Acidobacteriota bacterium]